MPVLEFTIPPQWDQKTVNSVAHGAIHLSSGQLKNAKYHGCILLDGMPVHTNERVTAGQLLRLEWPEKENTLPQPSGRILHIPFEDEHLMIIDKPAPLPTACSARQSGETLENAVYSHLNCPNPFVYRPVNRLDKGTSGLMIVAKSAYAQNLLQNQLHSDGFIREYLAVTEGIPSQATGMIDLPIGKAEGATIKREVREDGQSAQTQYHVLQTENQRALIRLRLLTGRTHQIRVHLASMGCPVAGDFLYGTELAELPGRFALHSTWLRVLHPITGQWLEYESALPKSLSGLLNGGDGNHGLSP